MYMMQIRIYIMLTCYNKLYPNLHRVTVYESSSTIVHLMGGAWIDHGETGVPNASREAAPAI